MVENVSLCLNTHLYFTRQKSNTDRVWKQQQRIQIEIDMSMRFWVLWLITLSSISLVWAADTQKRALASAIGVAGKPTTTTPIFLFNMARENALWADD